jgi:flagellar motor switch protein FliM
VEIEAVLHEQDLPLSKVLNLQPGQTLMFERAPSDPIRLRCGDVELTEAIMGHIGNHVSVRVSRPLNSPKVTMAAFDALDEKMEGR